LSSFPNIPSDEFPVLTDILVAGQIPIAMHTASGAGRSVEEKAPTPVAWEALEADVYEKVLKSLQGRIEGVIDQRLRDTVAKLLDQALSGLSTELKLSVRDTLRDVVQRAVAQEISRIRASKGSER